MSTPRSLRHLYRSARHRFRLFEQWLYARSILPRTSLTLPDFLGIGAQKAGTTWLHMNLQNHPDVFVPPDRQDLHFFNQKQHYGIRYYAKQFNDGEDCVKGENTPAYGVMSQKKVERVHTLLPEAKILFIMRDPIERAWSHARMTLTRNGRLVDDITDEEFYSHFRSNRSRERCDYISIIDKWSSVYNKDQIWIGFFDDVKERPKKFLSDVFSHIGVANNVDWSDFPYDKVVNKGPQVPIPPPFRDVLFDMYEDQISELQKRFGGPTLSWPTFSQS